jgi:hypothetical protein
LGEIARQEKDGGDAGGGAEGLVRGKIPSKATLQRELGAIKAAAIPLLVVTGGWSPAFEASSDVVAATGGGRRAVIQSEHHFPQLVSDEFNQMLAAFMGESEAAPVRTLR